MTEKRFHFWLQFLFSIISLLFCKFTLLHHKAHRKNWGSREALLLSSTAIEENILFNQIHLQHFKEYRVRNAISHEVRI